MAELLVPIFRVASVRQSALWYARLEFLLDDVHQFSPDLPLYGFLRRGDQWLHLSEHAGDAHPFGLAYFYVESDAAVTSIAAEFGTVVHDNDWGRDTQVVDPDGNRIRVGYVPN